MPKGKVVWITGGGSGIGLAGGIELAKAGAHVDHLRQKPRNLVC